MNRSENFFWAFIFALLFTCLIAMFCIVSVNMIDSLTLKDIGEESIPCLDKYSRPFEDEMCTKTVTCSWLGFVGDEKCSDTLVSGD